ncbi:hypothetical protein SteCoe_24990 [Stentor coeruleus]|uniref:Poly [ADP-ribose] polymerase n=1 Tax=Stentor coeruleus TaxID=5963 RepID=A0A1R2BGE4_9CILI|nr:hypothetical protein SteCoe_24990 [Stentor coeruleus]
MVQTRKRAAAAKDTKDDDKKDQTKEDKKIQKKDKSKDKAKDKTSDLPKKRARDPSPPAQKKSPSPSPPKQISPQPQQIPMPPVPTPAPEEQKIVKAIKKGRAVVDNECSKSSDCHVYEEPAKVWCCTLNQADLKDNANKYYIIQLLEEDKNPGKFYVWNRWGRVGYSGQNALRGPFLDLNKAKHEYNKKFMDKTKGGYIEVQISYEEETPEPQTSKKAVREETKQEESKLDSRVRDLVNLIFDLKTINSTLAEIGYDAKKMPLGKLSIATIKQGMEVLKEIENALEGAIKSDKLTGLSSKFYSLIPHDFGFKHMSNFIINSKEKLKEKIAMLENLTDMKIATNILEAAKNDVNPADDHYMKLKCGLETLEKNDPVYGILENYVKNTHAATHNSYGLTILDIFRVDKDGEDERFTKNLHNHMLLWHGSRLTNWVGILSQGLRIAPPEAPVSGYMFGKGVYFADMVSKSANYCFTNRNNNIGLLLLCDVALGNCNEKLYADYNANLLPDGKHSTKGCGRNAPPESSYIDLEGTKLPYGEGETVNVNGSLLYNEYIVYDIKQIKMKFLFKIRFDYKF